MSSVHTTRALCSSLNLGESILGGVCSVHLFGRLIRRFLSCSAKRTMTNCCSGLKPVGVRLSILGRSLCTKTSIAHPPDRGQTQGTREGLQMLLLHARNSAAARGTGCCSARSKDRVLATPKCGAAQRTSPKETHEKAMVRKVWLLERELPCREHCAIPQPSPRVQLFPYNAGVFSNGTPDPSPCSLLLGVSQLKTTLIVRLPLRHSQLLHSSSWKRPDALSTPSLHAGSAGLICTPLSRMCQCSWVTDVRLWITLPLSLDLLCLASVLLPFVLDAGQKV